ncbi:MAG: hypothetical protein ORO03_09445, partial [Alphaproteobacteria bacterium]|nr:hypothetical protein [Alphaproteobacteria bacterium]
SLARSIFWSWFSSSLMAPSVWWIDPVDGIRDFVNWFARFMPESGGGRAPTSPAVAAAKNPRKALPYDKIMDYKPNHWRITPA